MNELVIKTLEKNRLYDDNYQNVLINKEKDFFNNYKINKTNLNPLPNNVKRNKNGFIILDDEPFIISDLKTDGHNNNTWMLLDNGSRILLKKVEENEMYMELLFQELAKALNIPCAKYDVATLNNNNFLISQSFLSLDEYLLDYYNVEEKTFIDVEELIDEGKKIKQDDHVKKTLFIDILTKHFDRFPHNFKVIINNDNKKVSPLYDNGLCGIGYLYKTRFTFPEYKGSINPSNIIKFLISDEEFRNWVSNYINKINPISFKDKIKQEKGIYIDNDMNELFIKNVQENQTLTKRIIKNS